MLNREMRPSGIGYVVLESEADLKSALALDGKCIGDSKRYVRIGTSRTGVNVVITIFCDFRFFSKMIKFLHT
jgi:hypothetical protein